MAAYDEQLLKSARRLLNRRTGQRGPLEGARIRRSISTSYYALFHFLLDEITQRIVGSGNSLARRRRILARTISHRGLATALERIRGSAVHQSVKEFLQPSGSSGSFAAPIFAQELAKVFADAQAKRLDADYDLNKVLSEADARLLASRVRRGIKNWRAASGASDRDFKHAFCALALLKGQLRHDS